MFTISKLAAFAILAVGANAHMAMWHPSMYGFDDSYEPVTPLANKAFNQWWFHGYANQRPREVMSIYPGQTLNIEIACSKSYSTYGNSPNRDGCPVDAGSFHAGGGTGSGSGWSGNSESNLMGCALAISPKSSASATRPEDFTVMSVQENCVRQRDTPFAIPANLPSCPDGECTCAWFWQGQNSAAEMYMIGFRCKVENGVATAFPSPAKPKRRAISGATQPMYWANDNSNLDYNPGYDNRPSYNSKFGWSNGAQTSAFGAGTGGGNNIGSTASSSSRSSTSIATGGSGGGGGGQSSATGTSTTSTRRERPTSSSSSDASRPTDWYQHIADPSSATSAEGSKKTKVCRRGHLKKRRNRNHD